MTDLTDRMRTCAAFLVAWPGPTNEPVGLVRAAKDAADLLIEASNALEGDIADARRILHETADRVLGEPMEIIPPSPLARTIHEMTDALALRPHEHNPRACPKCDSRAGKRVDREGRRLMLTCPVCNERWEWKPKAEWV